MTEGDEPSAEFVTRLTDTLSVAIAKAEIRGALAAFEGVDQMVGDCLQMAIDHEMHDDLITGLVALSEDLRNHINDKIMPLRKRLP